MEVKKCLRCDKEFVPTINSQKYCSLKCCWEDKKRRGLVPPSRLGLESPMKGKHHTEESRKHMSEAHKGKPNHQLGRHHSEEAKKKIGEASKGRIPWNKGKLLSEEHKKNLSDTKKGKYKGDKSPNWRGGVSLKRGYKSFIERRRQIRKLKNGGSHTFGEWELLKAQYNWTCPCCGKSEPEIKLTEDHIVPLSEGGSDNIENLQPLCGSCNCKKHTRIFRVNPDKSWGLF